MKIEGLGINKVALYKRMEKNEKTNFAEMVLEKLKEIDQKERDAEAAILALAKGEEIDPAEVAMRISQADNSMKLLLRVRNKVLEAYQEIMRMQI